MRAAASSSTLRAAPPTSSSKGAASAAAATSGRVNASANDTYYHYQALHTTAHHSWASDAPDDEETEEEMIRRTMELSLASNAEARAGSTDMEGRRHTTSYLQSPAPRSNLSSAPTSSTATRTAGSSAMLAAGSAQPIAGLASSQSATKLTPSYAVPAPAPLPVPASAAVTSVSIVKADTGLNQVPFGLWFQPAQLWPFAYRPRHNDDTFYIGYGVVNADRQGVKLSILDPVKQNQTVPLLAGSTAAALQQLGSLDETAAPSNAGNNRATGRAHPVIVTTQQLRKAATNLRVRGETFYSLLACVAMPSLPTRRLLRVTLDSKCHG
jgi:hypothetical protein